MVQVDNYIYMNYVYNSLNRIADIVVSLVRIVCFLPMFVLVSLVVMAGSPGLPFFAQTRVGRNGRCFGMIKFRSMLIDANQRLDDPSV